MTDGAGFGGGVEGEGLRVGWGNCAGGGRFEAVAAETLGVVFEVVAEFVFPAAGLWRGWDGGEGFGAERQVGGVGGGGVVGNGESLLGLFVEDEIADGLILAPAAGGLGFSGGRLFGGGGGSGLAAGAVEGVHLVEGFQAGAHDGVHGAGLAGIDDGVGEGVGDVVEVEEDVGIIADPGEADQGDGGGGAGEGVADAFAVDQGAVVVAETEFAFVERGHGAAGAVGFDEAAAVVGGQHGIPSRGQRKRPLGWRAAFFIS